MDKQVIGLCVTVISLVVTYKVSAVMVIVKLVGVTARILHEGGVVERVMVADTVYVKEVVIDIDHLKTAELTSGREYQLAAVLTVLYEQYKDSYVRGTLAEIFERQYYLSFNSVTETRTDEDTGAQYEYRILKVTLVNRTLDTVIRGLGLSADQMARYEVLLETYGNKRYLFEEDIYSIVEPGRYGEYDVPPEALTNTRFSNMIREAEKYLGYPYVWGGSKPSTSFDCSGFVCWVINHSNNGWNVGRTTANGLLGRCTRVSASEAQPGDLIFFKGTYDVKGASHVAIYVGNGMMLHAGNPIQYTSINTNYWRKHFYTYGRING